MQKGWDHDMEAGFTWGIMSSKPPEIRRLVDENKKESNGK